MRLRKLSALACACVFVTALAADAAVADSQPPAASTAAPTAGLTQAAIQLLDSGSPVDVLMNPTTGAILSVTPVSGVSAAIKLRNGCDAGDGCYLTNSPPLSDEGFYGGTGTYYGSWASRSGYSSGDWTVYACWSGGCGPQIGPGSSVNFTSDVTGTSFTIVS